MSRIDIDHTEWDNETLLTKVYFTDGTIKYYDNYSLAQLENKLIAQNTEAKADTGKPRPSLVPTEIIWAIAAIRGYGNQKYGSPDNWRTVEWERYLDALDRHVLLFNENPFGIDEESGYPHLWHVACNVAFLCSMLDDDLKENMEEFKNERDKK